MARYHMQSAWHLRVADLKAVVVNGAKIQEQSLWHDLPDIKAETTGTPGHAPIPHITISCSR